MLIDIALESIINMDDDTLEYVLENMSEEELSILDEAMEELSERQKDMANTNHGRIALNVLGKSNDVSDYLGEKSRKESIHDSARHKVPDQDSYDRKRAQLKMRKDGIKRNKEEISKLFSNRHAEPVKGYESLKGTGRNVVNIDGKVTNISPFKIKSLTKETKKMQNMVNGDQKYVDYRRKQAMAEKNEYNKQARDKANDAAANTRDWNNNSASAKLGKAIKNMAISNSSVNKGVRESVITKINDMRYKG